MSAKDRVAVRLHGSIMAATDDLPDDLDVGVVRALEDLPTGELLDLLVERRALRQVPDLWVYDGEDVYVQGVPFGGWQRKGQGYRGNGLEPRRPVFVVEAPYRVDRVPAPDLTDGDLLALLERRVAAGALAGAAREALRRALEPDGG